MRHRRLTFATLMLIVVTAFCCNGGDLEVCLATCDALHLTDDLDRIGCYNECYEKWGFPEDTQ